jgi:phosphoribosylformimino-5-aminoimidazole carboxamide ribotide isomerase
MIIFPAIDLQSGCCVRLRQGDFDTSKVYSDNPEALLAEFAATGSEWVHMVDLDGAKQGKTVQSELIGSLVKSSKLKIEVGGGVRKTEDLEQLFAAGVKRVVVGSMCVTEPEIVNGWMERFGADKIVLALDCSLDEHDVPRVRTNGWQDSSTLSVYQLLDKYPTARYVLCTDVEVDGMLAGPNLALYMQILFHYPSVKVIASGGVGQLSDVSKLKQLGIYGVVIGKALYDKRFTLQEALDVV